MAKRRLSHQQSRRIKQAQDAVNLEHEHHYSGRVISHHGGEIEVQPSISGQKNLHCKIRKNLGAIVCGDQVIYSLQNDDPTIVAIESRKNLLQRQDGFGQIKSVAANVTQLLICLAVEPEPNLFLLDQYLLSAEQLHLHPLIILNKADLLDDNDTDPFDLKKIYAPLDYEVLQTSIIDQYNIDQLEQHCQGHINVISGVSGVGKSSLTKAILPELDISIGEISEVNKEGRHTTRTSRLYHLPHGGELIDTPGVRGFNPVLELGDSVASGFKEIRQHSAYCRFNNCKHINEPGCAVITALEAGDIAQSRYESYLKLLQGQK